MKKVLLAGEGRHELGGWFDHPTWRDPAEGPARGVLEALSRKVAEAGWKVAGGAIWKRIALYKAGSHRGLEARRIVRLALDAKEQGFDAVVFSRDQDTGSDAEDRREDVARGIQEARALFADGPPIAGGVAVPCIEGWVAAFAGATHTEAMSKPAAEQALRERGIGPTLGGMVAAVDGATASPARDATNLIGWLEEVRRVLG